MINLNDILDMSDLTREEIAVLAETEHLTQANAALEGEYLMHQHHGPAHVQRLICDDIRAAMNADDVPRARELWAVLKGYVAAHPESLRGSDPT